MFAAIHIPTGLIIAVLVVIIAVPLALFSIAAALGARGARSRGRRFGAIASGVAAGIVMTAAFGWFLHGLGAFALSAPLIGAGVSFAVARGMISAYQEVQP
jgi:hypothetical protein